VAQVSLLRPRSSSRQIRSCSGARDRACACVCLRKILTPRQNKGLSGRVDPIEMMERRGQHFWSSRSDRRRHSPSLDPSPNEAIRVVYSVGPLRPEGRLRRTMATRSAHAFSLGRPAGQGICPSRSHDGCSRALCSVSSFGCDKESVESYGISAPLVH
jgi:hypothetical protein